MKVAHKLRFLLEAFLVACVMLLLPLRWIAQWILRGRALSVWTGRPIITLAVKCRAERLLGVNAVSVVTQSYFVTEAFDLQLASSRHPRAFRYAMAWLGLAGIFVLARRVHTFFDGGILPAVNRFQFNPRELLAYRIAGIEHVAWSYGADVRTRDATLALGEPNCCTHCDAVGLHCICDAGKAQENLVRVVRGARFVATMGDMNEYVPMARHDLHFWPLDTADQRFQRARPAVNLLGPLRVVHAPNHPQFKGSRYLVDAVQALQREGHAIDLVLVERTPNAEALKIYQSADLIFDQCLIGFHGYFALEAMALSKPVMVFIRKPSYLLHSEECPLINVNRETIAATLRGFVLDRTRLAGIGDLGREYVRRYYGLEAFAARLARTYEQEGMKP